MTSRHDIYIEQYVIPEIMRKLEKEQLISFKVEQAESLDSFMSCLYNIQLKTETAKGESQRLLFAKFMRGDKDFRESTKSYTQWANEVYTYSKVITQYDKLLKDLKVDSLQIMKLVPTIYQAKFGYIPGLSCGPQDREASLVMENLKPLGYQMGPRSALSRTHLVAMCQSLAKWHAMSYALKALKPSEFERLKTGIITFPFLNESDPNDSKNNFYRVLHRHAFDRLFEFYDRTIDTDIFDRNSPQDLKLMFNLNKLKEKYNDLPSRLQENLRTKVDDYDEDRYFAAILHGDYNRNNVLFKYQTNGEEYAIEDMKMLDFQQLRYGSPCLDLSFFMYFNIHAEERHCLWLELLKTYHECMFSTLTSILNASALSKQETCDILQHYSFEKFERHFSRFAFYGVMICMHFLPWMLCSDEECCRISELYASDMHGEEFRKLSLEAGGDEVNLLLLAAVRHASEMGYMEDL